MDTFEHGMEKILVPVATKLNFQIHVSTTRDVFILSFPIVMASLLIILINFAILSPGGFIASILHLGTMFPHLAEAQQIFTSVINGSVSIMVTLITFLVARSMAISYQRDDLLYGLAVIGAFFVMYMPYTIIDGQAYLAARYLDPQGLFVAVIVALIPSEVSCRLACNLKVIIMMPAVMPPAVARSFRMLLPIFFVTIFFPILNYLLTRILPNDLNGLIYTLIRVPLKNMGINIVTALVLGSVANFLRILGIYRSNTVTAIHEAILSEANLENPSYAASYGSTWEVPYPIAWAGINDTSANCGGSGTTLGLLLAIFIASRRNGYRDLAGTAFVPGLLNINGPAVFGLPIVLNPILATPFVLVPFVNSLIGYFFTSMELIPLITYAMPWIIPGLFIAFFGTGGNWLALFVGILCLAISTLIYLPFVIVANKVSTAVVTDQEDGDVCR